MAIKRVFIAGAICGKCGAMDRVQRCKSDDHDDYWMECLVCGMKQEMRSEPDEGLVTAAPDPSIGVPIRNINDLGLKHK